jgi:Na+-translocating ferredoxin:NAD+ oxidoreductase subunit E
MSHYQQIINDGLWKNNPAMVQILGMCPMLAVSNTMVNATGLAFATILALVATNTSISLIRNYVPPQIRIPVFVLVIASVVTMIELIMKAYFYELYQLIGLFIALITTNCIVIARAEAFASKQPVHKAALDGLFMGLGFGSVLLVLGTFRELLGFGTLLQNAQLLFGESGKHLSITVIDNYRGFLIAIVPPGAFLGLGLLIAVKNRIDQWRAARVAKIIAPQVSVST